MPLRRGRVSMARRGLRVSTAAGGLPRTGPCVRSTDGGREGSGPTAGPRSAMIVRSPRSCPWLSSPSRLPSASQTPLGQKTRRGPQAAADLSTCTPGWGQQQSLTLTPGLTQPVSLGGTSDPTAVWGHTAELRTTEGEMRPPSPAQGPPPLQQSPPATPGPRVPTGRAAPSPPYPGGN